MVPDTKSPTRVGNGSCLRDYRGNRLMVHCTSATCTYRLCPVSVHDVFMLFLHFQSALSLFRFLFLFTAGLIAVFGSKLIGFSGAGALGCLTVAFVAGYRWRQTKWNFELVTLSPFFVFNERKQCIGLQVKPATVFNYLWIIFQPLLFGLIGSEVDLEKIQPDTVGLAMAVMICGLIVRILFTMIAVSGAGLNWKEKLFCGIAWIPKATVQAALGTLALDEARILYDNVKRGSSRFSTSTLNSAVMIPDDNSMYLHDVNEAEYFVGLGEKVASTSSSAIFYSVVKVQL